VYLIARVVAEILPLSLELFLKEFSFERALTSLTVVQLMSSCWMWESIVSKAVAPRPARPLLVLFCGWALFFLSILCWLFGSVVLHRCGMS